jgi:serpin B
MPSTSEIAGNTRFAFKLFGALTAGAPSENIFFSPASVALALALAANGARGATWRAFAQALDLGAADLEQLNRAGADTLRALGQADPQVELAIANSLWVRQGWALDPEFARRCATYYGAEAANLDFASPRAADTINSWVAQRTHHKIERIVEQIGGDARLFLINAIYFKGRWSRPFDPRLTTAGSFTPAGRAARPHPLMTQRGSFRYAERAEFQAVSLPYGGGRLAMEIFLPAPRSSLAALCAALDDTSWRRWQTQFSDTEGLVQLPRFRLAYAASLNEPLKALGLEVAFGAGADFGGMLQPPQPLCIDEVRHKAFVEVNEAGTEAAAVTSIGMQRATFMPKKTFRMVVDRPFLCAIRDTLTGTLLFLGAITDPADVA